MKAGIHPEYVEATITCACGNVIRTRSTRKNLHVDICNVCHPYFTGTQKYVDTAGRVERFQRRYRQAPGAAAAPRSRTVANATRSSDAKK